MFEVHQNASLYTSCPNIDYSFQITVLTPSLSVIALNTMEAPTQAQLEQQSALQMYATQRVQMADQILKIGISCIDKCITGDK